MTPDEYQAMVAQPLTDFQRRLAWLDASLTESRYQDIERNARQQRFSPAAFLGLDDDIRGDHAYYLSDGGYSRLCYSWENRSLFLTSNSSEAARQRWETEDVKILAVAVNEAIEAYRKTY